MKAKRLEVKITIDFYEHVINADDIETKLLYNIDDIIKAKVQRVDILEEKEV